MISTWLVREASKPASSLSPPAADGTKPNPVAVKLLRSNLSTLHSTHISTCCSYGALRGSPKSQKVDEPSLSLSLVARRTNTTTTTTSLSRAIPQIIHFHHQSPTPPSHIHPSRCSPDDSLRASRLRPSSLLLLPPDSSAPPSFPSSSLPPCRKGYQA
jgi:hypothetical protein